MDSFNPHQDQQAVSVRGAGGHPSLGPGRPARTPVGGLLAQADGITTPLLEPSARPGPPSGVSWPNWSDRLFAAGATVSAPSS